MFIWYQQRILCAIYFFYTTQGQGMARSKACGSRSEVLGTILPWSSENARVNAVYWHVKSAGLKVLVYIYTLVVWSWGRVLRMSAFERIRLDQNWDDKLFSTCLIQSLKITVSLTVHGVSKKEKWLPKWEAYIVGCYPVN